jgi:hypothetical protein
MSEPDVEVESKNPDLNIVANYRNLPLNEPLRDMNLFDHIMQDIRDMNVLSTYQIYYLSDVPRIKLLQIIELYNVVMRNVNEIL